MEGEENEKKEESRRKENKKKDKRKEKEKEAAPTPAQAQKALSDQPSANLPRHRHVGLPGLSEDPAEGRQEEKVQKGRCHDTDALSKKRTGKDRERKKKLQSLLFKQPQKKQSKQSSGSGSHWLHKSRIPAKLPANTESIILGFPLFFFFFF